MSRKIIQISAAMPSDGQQWDALYALCDDGTVWERQWRGSAAWLQHPPIPQPSDPEAIVE